MKKTVLKIDGYFLATMGTVAGAMDLVAYFTGKGPFGEAFYQNSTTIGGFEAHCLAIISGLILILKRKSDDAGFFCKVAIGIHLALRISNLVWFRVFYDTNTLPMGIITTLAHFGFIISHLMVLRKRPFKSFDFGIY